MNLILENPTPIWALGAVCFAVGVIVFLAKRSISSIIAMAGVVVATALLLFVERAVITPSEEVEHAVATVMAAIEANDLPSVLAMIDSYAQSVRSDAETLMPQVKVRETGATAVRVEVSNSANSPRATAYFRARIDGTHARTGARVFYFDQVEVDWQKSGDEWVVIDYRVMLRGKPVRATEAFRAIR